MIKKSVVPFRICLSHILLALLIITYTVYFSWYTINRHNTLNSYAADLSLIDQPMWNTVLGPGYLMERTWGNQQQPRLAEHFEPILIPLALLFFLWDDVRILLIAQSAALALGALPVFWIAQHQLSRSNYQSPTHNSRFTIATWAALVFVGVYLLSTHLQAANVADFHADPFVVAPLLFAFWYATQRRWGWMWFWAIVAMSTKETLPTLTAMLGLFLIFDFYKSKRPNTLFSNPIENRKSKIENGFTLILVSTVWFLIATFLIVAPLARQYFGTDGPIYFDNRYSGELADLPQLLQDPARWSYIFGLLASVGFLPLLAPELLLLGLPVLVANLLSNFPGQFSGEQHYSAPLVVALIIAAIYGTRHLVNWTSLREVNGQVLKVTTLIATLLWLAAWSLSYHTIHGWTPLSTRTETYRLSPAAARLPALIGQVPPETTVSASAAIHPHLAHRRVIYIFPTVSDAEYMLVDVTDIPGIHPNDAHAQIEALLNTDWQLLQADHGLILAQKSPSVSSISSLPDTFFDFARATGRPAFSTPLIFGDGQLQLLGYDVHDDPDDGVIFRFYWQVLERLPEDLRLWPLVYNDLGQVLSNPGQVPMIAALWYPPGDWQPGETIITETLPQLLPDTFHLGIAVGPENSLADPTRRFPITSYATHKNSELYPGNWAQLGTFKRQKTYLSQLPVAPSLHAVTPTDIQFGPAIHLTGFWFETDSIQSGSTLSVLIQWTATQPPEADFTVFIHLLASDGSLIAQSDAPPTWLTPAPTSRWPLDQPVADSHVLILPNNLPQGTYILQIGLYHPQTLERLALPNGENALILGEIKVR